MGRGPLPGHDWVHSPSLSSSPRSLQGDVFRIDNTSRSCMLLGIPMIVTFRYRAKMSVSFETNLVGSVGAEGGGYVCMCVFYSCCVSFCLFVFMITRLQNPYVSNYLCVA